MSAKIYIIEQKHDNGFSRFTNYYD